MSNGLPVLLGFSRVTPAPLDISTVFSTFNQLTSYVALSGNSYAGQICAVSATNQAYLVNSNKTVSLIGLNTSSGFLSLNGGTVTGNINALSFNNMPINRFEGSFGNFNTVIGRGTNEGQTATGLYTAVNNIGRNTVVGFNAGLPLSEGTHNSFFGVDAGRLATSGHHNTAVGQGALGSVTTGSCNVGVGGGIVVNEGNSNTFIGHNSGATQGLVNNNTVLGASSNVAGFSNTLLLGLSAVASKNNDLSIGSQLVPVSGTMFGNLAITNGLTVTGNISGNNLFTSFNQGSASGNYSFAAGVGARALGPESFAQGKNTVASGQASHVEGESTLAAGAHAHSEGFNTTAAGDESHSEGHSSYSSGIASHAEGWFTNAIGNYSHAEGQGTQAVGLNSHSEGTITTAVGEGSHSEGKGTTAIGLYSHTEGSSTSTAEAVQVSTFNRSTLLFTFTPQLSSKFSYVLPNDTIYGRAIFAQLGLGNFSFKVASRDTTNGSISALATDSENLPPNGSTAIRLYDRNVTGANAHAEGSSTAAFGTASHAEGSNTTASGNNSHAEGAGATASGSSSHAEGSNTVASGARSHAEGYYATAAGNFGSHAEGRSTIASGDASHAEGASTATGEKVPFATYTSGSRTFTFTSQTSANFAYVVAGTGLKMWYFAQMVGYNLSGLTTVIVESRNPVNGDIIITSTGPENPPNNPLSIYGYIFNNSGSNAHAEGNSTTASREASHAEGYLTRAGGIASHAAGFRATAAQNYTYAWSDGILGTATTDISSTRTGQYMVSASGGMFIPGNVGIGTDSIENPLTVVGNISASGYIISPSIVPTLPVPRIKLKGTIDNLGVQVPFLSGRVIGEATSWTNGGMITLKNYPVLAVTDFTAKELSRYNIFIEMVIYKRVRSSKPTGRITQTIPYNSYTIPLGNANNPWTNVTNYIRNGDQGGVIKNAVTRYNHLPVIPFNTSDQGFSINLTPCLHGHLRTRKIEYIPTNSPSSPETLECIVPFGRNEKILGTKYPYSKMYKPLYVGFRYICWVPPNSVNANGSFITGPLSPTIKISNTKFPFITNDYSSSLIGAPVADLNPTFNKNEFYCTFC